MAIQLLLHKEYSDSSGEDVPCSHPKRYTNLAFIGCGSFGNVFRADDVVIGHAVVIKSIDLSLYNRRRHDLKKVAREAKILYFIDCPQLVKLKWMYTNVTSADTMKTVYLVMSYCGVTLKEFICEQEQSGHIQTLDEMSYIVYEISLGINYLNSLDIYHRDLKPSNVCVMCHDDGHFKSVKIIDLGMARSKPCNAADATSGVTTLCYQAPEMLLCDTYKEKVDIWSIGCIFGYMLNVGNEPREIFRDKQSKAFLTLRKVIELIGKPSQAMVNRIHKKKKNIDPQIYEQFVSCLNRKDDNVDESNFFNNLFEARFNPERTTDDKLTENEEDGIALLRGMLKCDPEERYSIQKVLESNFVRKYRSIEKEETPPSELREAVKDILVTSERDTKGKSVEELKEVIFEHIVEKYLIDSEGKSYPYQPINHLRTLPMWILKPICVTCVVLTPFTLYGYLGYTAPQALVTSGVALLFILGGSLIVEKFFK